MISFNSVMLGSQQTKLMGEFYEKVIGRPSDMKEDSWYGWQLGSCFLSIGDHSEVGEASPEPQRVILNFESDDVKSEFERIKELGAKVIKEPYEMQGAWIATFADPDGNYFQLMPPWDNTK